MSHTQYQQGYGPNVSKGFSTWGRESRGVKSDIGRGETGVVSHGGNRGVGPRYTKVSSMVEES